MPPEALVAPRSAPRWVRPTWSCSTWSAASPNAGGPGRLPGKPFPLRAPPQAVELLVLLGTDCVTLANNHALDYGLDALADTLNLLATGRHFRGGRRLRCRPRAGIPARRASRGGLRSRSWGHRPPGRLRRRPRPPRGRLRRPRPPGARLAIADGASVDAAVMLYPGAQHDQCAGPPCPPRRQRAGGSGGDAGRRPFGPRATGSPARSCTTWATSTTTGSTRNSATTCLLFLVTWTAHRSGRGAPAEAGVPHTCLATGEDVARCAAGSGPLAQPSTPPSRRKPADCSSTGDSPAQGHRPQGSTPPIQQSGQGGSGHVQTSASLLHRRRNEGLVSCVVTEVLGRLRDAQNRHDLDAFVACFDPQHRSEQPPHPDRAFVGREQVAKNWAEVFAGVPSTSRSAAPPGRAERHRLGRVALARHPHRRDRPGHARGHHLGLRRPVRFEAGLTWRTSKLQAAGMIDPPTARPAPPRARSVRPSTHGDSTGTWWRWSAR